MKKNKAVRILTVASFAVLLTSFIAFKTGLFDRLITTDVEKQLDDSVRTLESLTKDTLTKGKADTVKNNPTMLSTSKSLILIEQKIEFPTKDSLKLTPKK